MKMDWGYESETGQVWLFNVTPFTPHLPHWQPGCVCMCVCCVCVCVCVFTVLCEVVLFVCILVRTHMHILLQHFFFVNTESSMRGTTLAGLQMCSEMFLLFNMNVRHSRRTHVYTHSGQALNCMNNRIAVQTAWNTCFSETCVNGKKCSGMDKKRGSGVYEMEHKFYPTGWCDLDVSLLISISLTLSLSHTHLCKPLLHSLHYIPSLLICVKLKLFISGEREIILRRDGGR